MRCEEIREKMEAYLDGELPSDTLRAVAEHLTACHECTRLFAARRSFGDLVREGLDITAPQDLQDELHAALAVQSTDTPEAGVASRYTATRRHWLTLTWTSGLAAAAVVTVALVAWWLVDHYGSPTVTEAFSRPATVHILRFEATLDRDGVPEMGGLILANHL